MCCIGFNLGFFAHTVFSVFSGHSGFPISFEINYGSGTVKGIQVEEQVMMKTTNPCAYGIPFFVVVASEPASSPKSFVRFLLKQVDIGGLQVPDLTMGEVLYEVRHIVMLDQCDRPPGNVMIFVVSHALFFTLTGYRMQILANS